MKMFTNSCAVLISFTKIFLVKLIRCAYLHL